MNASEPHCTGGDGWRDDGGAPLSVDENADDSRAADIARHSANGSAKRPRWIAGRHPPLARASAQPKIRPAVPAIDPAATNVSHSLLVHPCSASVVGFAVVLCGAFWNEKLAGAYPRTNRDRESSRTVEIISPYCNFSPRA
jgi:hypothetical protein